MHNLRSTGHVDPATWSILTAKPVDEFPLVTGYRAAVIARALRFLGAPYLHGSSEAWAGLDPLGFVDRVYSSENDLDPFSLQSLVDEQFIAIPERDIKPADLVVYHRKDGAITHALVLLNMRLGIGPLGGNAATTTIDMALKRNACVKIKPYRYRDRYSIRRLRGIDDSAEKSSTASD